LKKLSSETIDLILADINMPVMDGLKLVSLVRNNPSYKDIPIIIITTEGAKEDKERAMAIGANAYLAKPIQTQELIRMVSSFVGS
ncbi:MAG: response regulator, partial [Candidatus Dadabacteria bacterium]